VSENGDGLLAVQVLLGFGFSANECMRIYQEIMFGVFENHVNGFVFKDDLLESDYIFVRDLSIQLKRGQ
jgi:hypothetical protein